MSETLGRAKAGLKDLKKIFGAGQSDVRQFGILFSLIAIIVLFQVLTHGLTLSSGNLVNLISEYSYILILAIGMVMVIIAGHIDLSVGSVAAFAGIVVATSMQSWHFPWPLAILLGLFVGVLIGAWQGFWVAYIGVPAFIVTLAGMLIFRGGNQVIGNANTVPVPQGFTTIGAGYLPEVGPNSGYNNLTLLLGLIVAVAVVLKEGRPPGTGGDELDACPHVGQHSEGRPAGRRGHLRLAAVRGRPHRHELPGLGNHPGSPRALLLLRHAQHHLRAPRLRGRWEQARR
jgi:putative multiple sugar transport system permease protein